MTRNKKTKITAGAGRDPIVPGVLLFAAGVVLFLVGVAGAPVLFSVATVLFILGWSLPYLAIARTRASAITGPTLALPVVLTLGLFYYMASHADHVQSGLGFGLDHTTHNLLGFGILVLTEALTLGVALRSQSEAAIRRVEAFGESSPGSPPAIGGE